MLGVHSAPLFADWVSRVPTPQLSSTLDETLGDYEGLQVGGWCCEGAGRRDSLKRLAHLV